ncbi:MAG: O-methyltransferase [Actinomycetota bacterium]
MSQRLGLGDELHAYVVEHGTPPDAVLQRLAATTEEQTGPFARMQIAPEQGALLTWLTRVVSPARALEVGTFTGYSAICIVRGLVDGGRLLCLDVSEDWTSIARAAWQEAGLDDRIELRLGPAADSLAEISVEPPFDLAFIDADKTGYETYLDLVHPRLRTGGVVVVDNVLRRGTVLDAETDNEDTKAIQAFNHARTTDERWDTMMLAIGDGLTLLRKR